VLLGKLPSSQATYVTMRAAAANYIESHTDDFLPFLPTTEDAVGTSSLGLMTPQQFREYCSAIRSTAVWGGEPEIQALSRAFNVPIYVVQGEKPSVVTIDPSGESHADSAVTQGGVWLSYHRKLYGLGEVCSSFYASSVAKVLLRLSGSTTTHYDQHPLHDTLAVHRVDNPLMIYSHKGMVQWVRAESDPS
jgi:hypothetical protein